MSQIIPELLETYRRNRRLRRRSMWVFIALAFLVIGGVVWQMKQPGVSLSEQLICELEEHQHSEECYAQVLVCGLEESEDQVIPGHHHTEDCYQPVQVCTCSLEEHVHTEACYNESGELVCLFQDHTHIVGCYDANGALICTAAEHVHGDTCYDQEGNLICGLEEHTHTNGCYTWETVLVCGLDESEDQVIPGHTHTEECYETQLVCGKEEHLHTADCYAKPEPEDQELGITVGTPSPDPEASPSPDPEASPTPDPEASPSPDPEASPTPDPEASPTPDPEASPSPDPEASPSPGPSVSPDPTPVPQSPDSSASAYHVAGPSRAMSRAALFAAPRANGTGTDFGQYITNAAVEKPVQGVWTPVSPDNPLYIGDSVQVTISYNIDAGVVTTTNPTIHYQLPQGISLTASTSGNVLSGNEIVGQYSITENGYIEITFYESFIQNGSPIAGNVQFNGVIAAGDTGGGYDINFGYDGGTIHVTPNPDKDKLRITKTAPETKNLNAIKYQIVLNSDAGAGGTDGPITVTDQFQNQTTGVSAVEYIESSFVVKRIASNGSASVPLGYSVNVTQNGSTPSFTISNLPALADGDAYVITYQVKATPVEGNNGYNITLDNIATARTANLGTFTSEKVLTLSGNMVNKVGAFDPGSDTLTYWVTINEAGQDVSGWKIRDELTIGNKTFSLPSDLKVDVYAFGKYYDTISLPYTIPPNVSNSFELVYTIYDVSEKLENLGGNIDSISNTATVGIYKDTYTVINPEGAPGVVKQALTQGKPEENPSNPASPYQVVWWQTEIAVPAGATSLTYQDIISDLTFDGKTYPGLHFTSILDAVTLWASGNTPYYAYIKETGVFFPYTRWWGDASEYSCFDVYVNNKDIAQMTKSELNALAGTPVTEFEIRFTKNGLQLAGGNTVVLIYPTLVNMTDLVQTGTYVAGNTGIINGIASYAETTWTVDTELEKQASATGIAENETTTSYTGNGLTVSLEETGGKIFYRLLIETGSASGDITVTDTLPDGTTLLDNSVSLRGHSTEYESYPLSGDLVTVSKNDQTVTFQISESAYKGATQYHRLALYYEVSVADDPYWDDPTHTEKTYKNTAYWHDNVTLSTTVTRQVNMVEKSGELLPGDTNTIRYTVVVNKDANDLVENNDWITLKDTLELQHHVTSLLKLETIQVYNYTPANPDQLGPELGSDEYNVNYEEGTHVITFTLPDSRALVVVYEYQIDASQVSDEVIVTNTVSLHGTAYSTVTDEVAIDKVGSSATANTATLTIYKVEQGQITTTLPGAKFTLERYEQADDGTYSWKTTSISGHEDGYFVTDENGKLVLHFLEDNENGSLYHTLYRLTEAQAPEGYRTGNSVSYFVWLQNGQTEETATAEMQDAGAFGKVDPTEVRFIGYSDTLVSETIQNTPTKLTVEKKWKNFQGETLIEDLPASIQVTLYQYTTDKEDAIEYKEPITLTAQNGWTYTWKALPTKNNAGEEYHYYVKESGIEGFVESYSEDATLVNADATITITNKKEDTYLLPETGGFGPGLFCAGGAALVFTGGLCGAVLYRRKRGGRRKRRSR